MSKIYKKLLQSKNIKTKSIIYSNRGLSLEEKINKSNIFYRENNICVIFKKPTPINVIKVNYSLNKITEACFEKKSTTDYNGIYKGKYIDFEVKSTLSKTSFPLSNIGEHQIKHLKMISNHKGIAFFIVEFKYYDKIFLLTFDLFNLFINSNNRKSIPYKFFLENCTIINQGLKPRINYIEAIDKVYSI